MADDAGAWVYAVAGGIQREWLDGVSGVAAGSVHSVAAAGLAAAVTAVNLAEFGEEALRDRLEDLSWLETTARSHHSVIEAVGLHAPVVPLRLATIYHGDAGVAAMLAERREAFAATLGRVAARTEWGVKVYQVARPDPRASAAGPVRPAAGGAGAAYLRRRRMELSASDDSRRAAAAGAENVHAELRLLAAASQLRPPQGPQLTGKAAAMILNAAYLVDDERSGAFAVAVENLAARHPGVRIELTGPWPAYSFATVDEPETAG